MDQNRKVFKCSDKLEENVIKQEVTEVDKTEGEMLLMLFFEAYVGLINKAYLQLITMDLAVKLFVSGDSHAVECHYFL